MRPGIEALRALPLLRAFDLALLGKLNEFADLARIGPREVLFKQGDRTDALNILVSGYVTIVRSQPGGGDSVTDVIAPVRAIGFAAALLGVGSPTAARTVTSARLIIIPAPDGAGEPAPAAGTMPRHSAALTHSLLLGLLGAFSTTLL
jgi:CRP-like cAMP-binding protein